MSYYVPLNQAKQFKQLYAVGQKIVFPELVVYWKMMPRSYVPNLPEGTENKHKTASSGTQVAFVASRKVGNAVKRNRCKRLLRAVFYPYFKQLNQSAVQIVFVARYKLLTVCFEKLDQQIKKLMTQILKPEF